MRLYSELGAVHFLQVSSTQLLGLVMEIIDVSMSSPERVELLVVKFSRYARNGPLNLESHCEHFNILDE